MGRVIPVLLGLLGLAIAVALWPHWRPERNTAPDATQTADYDHARALLAQLPVKGWDRHTDFVRYRFRRIVERRRQRGVRPQRVQHPRRHTAP